MRHRVHLRGVNLHKEIKSVEGPLRPSPGLCIALHVLLLRMKANQNCANLEVSAEQHSWDGREVSSSPGEVL